MGILQNSINVPTPFAVADGGTGNTAALTDRQVWLGKTSTPLAPVPTTLTPGNGITLTDGSGTLTVAASTAFTWHNTSATTIVMSPFNAYNLLSLTPVDISFAGGFQMGDMFIAVCNGSTFVVTADDPLSIVYDGSTGHTFTSTVDGSIVTFVCTGLIFNVYTSDGAFTLT